MTANCSKKTLQQQLEIERERLCLVIQEKGLNSKEALIQSRIVDSIINQLNKI